MPKSKHSKEINDLHKKLRKLERKINKKKRHRRRRDKNCEDSDCEKLSDRSQIECETIDINDEEYCGDNTTPPPPLPDETEVPMVTPPSPTLTTSAAAVAGTLEPTVLEKPIDDANCVISTEASTNMTSIDLDPDLIEILGEDPTSTKEFDPPLQKDLAIRLNHIAISGLSKEDRKEIKGKYLIPENCTMIKAPSLNPEIRASLQESQAKKDKGIENRQIMTSCALSSLGKAMTILLSSGYKNQELLKAIMDSARTLADIQHNDSMLRRFFILSTVKKELKDQLEKTKIDETLFGKNLPETLKCAKHIHKSGDDIRSFKPMNIPKQQPKLNRTLNYRAPLANRRMVGAGVGGGTRAPRLLPPQPPAPTLRPSSTMNTMHHNSYKTLSRQPKERFKR